MQMPQSPGVPPGFPWPFTVPPTPRKVWINKERLEKMDMDTLELVVTYCNAEAFDTVHKMKQPENFNKDFTEKVKTHMEFLIGVLQQISNETHARGKRYFKALVEGDEKDASSND